jgi:hypothetical protein
MFRSKRTIIRPVYKNLVYEWMDKAFEISEGVHLFKSVSRLLNTGMVYHTIGNIRLVELSLDLKLKYNG